MPFPYCVTSLQTANVEFRTGATGPVNPSVETDGRSAAFYVRTSTNRETGAERCTMGGDAFAYPVPRGGRWTVLQGAVWGNTVDIEIRDVTFEPFDGHELVIPYGRWVAELPSDPPEYP
jgi:hypothetical protein